MFFVNGRRRREPAILRVAGPRPFPSGKALVFPGLMTPPNFGSGGGNCLPSIVREAYKEQMAVHGKTLTALGSYWKGRKPLILNKACILGCLLPTTADPTRDLCSR